jgi:hypothetical protein
MPRRDSYATSLANTQLQGPFTIFSFGRIFPNGYGLLGSYASHRIEKMGQGMLKPRLIESDVSQGLTSR